MGCIVHVSDEIMMASLGGNFHRPRDISMYFITECLGLHTDSELRDRLLSSACVDAGLAVLLPQTWVKCDSGDKPIGHKLVSTRRCKMPHALVQLHDADNFNSIACLAFCNTQYRPHGVCSMSARHSPPHNLISR